MQKAEYDRDEKEGGNRGEDQAANHSATEGRVLFAAFAQPQSHRHHADDHRQRGQNNERVETVFRTTPMAALTPLATSSVEALPFFRTLSMELRMPS